MICNLFENCFVDQIGHDLLHSGVKYFPKTSVRVKCVTSSIYGAMYSGWECFKDYLRQGLTKHQKLCFIPFFGVTKVFMDF